MAEDTTKKATTKKAAQEESAEDSTVFYRYSPELEMPRKRTGPRKFVSMKAAIELAPGIASYKKADIEAFENADSFKALISDGCLQEVTKADMQKQAKIDARAAKQTAATKAPLVGAPDEAAGAPARPGKV